MNRIYKLIILLALLNLDSAYAQWSGALKADGAWDLKRGDIENIDFKLKHQWTQFYLGTNLYFGHSFLPTSETTYILDGKKEKDEYYKGEYKAIDPSKFKAGAKLDMGYKFKTKSTLDATFSYAYNGTNEKSKLQSERFNNSDMSFLEGEQIDTNFIRIRNFNFNAAYNKKFDSRPDARLGVNLSNATKNQFDANRRVSSGDFYPKEKNYATYSSLNDIGSKLAIFYDDIIHLGKNDLKLKSGFDFNSNQDIDAYSAENNENGHWRDSARFRQSYFYNSFTGEPYINLTFTLGKFDFFVREKVQLYWHAMIDKLDDVKKPEDTKILFNKFDARNLLNLGITFRANDKHRITAEYGRTISRPDYKKLCPTMMIGKSEGEFFIGNPDLLPEVTDKLNVSYFYTRGIFVTRLDLNYSDKRNTAEKVIDLEKSKDITDPGVKTIYTWINNKRLSSLGTKLNLKVNGSSVKSEIWAAFNYDTYFKSGALDKNDFNYELGTSIDVFLTQTTKLSSSIAYISEKRSAYNLKGEDVIANLRFSKTIIKGLELYAELKDIVDKEIYEETWNANMNYLKIVTKKPAHRAALIGINYIF